DFYPRSPRGERQMTPRQGGPAQSISIHAPREGSDMTPRQGGSARSISIHAPREGSDMKSKKLLLSRLTNFYPRSPRGERLIGRRHRHDHRHFYPRSPRGERHTAERSWSTGLIFLSTLPARGATRLSFRRGKGVGNFYPRSPRGERRDPR